MTPVERVGGRLVLLDPDGRVLLINERIGGGATHWLTPGGGVEAGETPAQAAGREAFEEIGLRVELDRATPSVLETERLWSWAGVTYHQIDHFFLARVGHGIAIEPQGLTAMEHETLLGHRWWTLQQLRLTAETIVPPELGDVLAALLDTASAE